ncbi:MAG: hypothetical protein PHG65_08885, partial [Kiritimatiellae bacterium]|nr:hypothetical protein [Kiritimatiellia bacterium]
MNLTRWLSGGEKGRPGRSAVYVGVLIGCCFFAGCRVAEQKEKPEPAGAWIGLPLPGVAFKDLSACRSAETVSGTFSVEASFDGPAPFGLALVCSSNNRPDPENFTAIMVERTVDGVPVVRIRNRLNGEEDVYDSSGVLLSAYEEKNAGHPEEARRLFSERYRHILDGRQYSVPFTNTTGKLRIHHDAGAGFLHFYYSVEREIRGQRAEGWMELTPAPDWGLTNESYYIACIESAPPAETVDYSSRVTVTSIPAQDRDDAVTGFAVTRRDFFWSGFGGEAVVVTFGDEFPFRDRDIKLVFWSLANYVPVWRFSDELLYSYEFLETWGGGNRGCHEPMSDRLHRWTRVDVVEDNAVRKVIRWRYVLCNPDYKVPDDAIGSQLPEVEELYTCYPNGTVIRHMTYWPKLDAPHRKWVELAELIPIAGSRSDPEEHLAKPALSLFSLDDGPYPLLPGPQTGVDGANRWEQIIADAHFADAPDAFIAFSNAGDTPQLHPGYRTCVNLSWHDVVYKMAHWPVGLEPYQEDDKTQGDWPMQISHTGLLGFGAY